MYLKSISIKDFRSIKELNDFQLNDVNILVGHSGAGKSNFLKAISLLKVLVQGQLQRYVSVIGKDNLFRWGGDGILHLKYEFEDGYKDYEYDIMIERYHDEVGIIGESLNGKRINTNVWESNLCNEIKPEFAKKLSKLSLYHFNDFSDNAGIFNTCYVNDNLILKPDASNLCAILKLIKDNNLDSYNKIINGIKLHLDSFNDFFFDYTKDYIQLDWIDNIKPSIIHNAHNLPDSILHLACITTLLNLPDELMPDILIIDEPELGLNGYNQSLVASLLSRASKNTQIIIATGSERISSFFDRSDRVIVNNVFDKYSAFNRY